MMLTIVSTTRLDEQTKTGEIERELLCRNIFHSGNSSLRHSTLVIVIGVHQSHGVPFEWVANPLVLKTFRLEIISFRHG